MWCRHLHCRTVGIAVMLTQLLNTEMAHGQSQSMDNVTWCLLAICRGPLRNWLKVFFVLFDRKAWRSMRVFIKLHWLQTQKRCEPQNFIFQSIVDLDLAWQSKILVLVKTNIGSSAVLRRTVLMSALYSKPLTEDVLYSWWNRLWLNFKHSWLLKEKRASVKNVSSNRSIQCSKYHCVLRNAFSLTKLCQNII